MGLDTIINLITKAKGLGNYDKVIEKQKRLSNSTKKLSEATRTNERLIKQVGTTTRTFSQLMTNTGLEVKKSGKIFDENSKKYISQKEAVARLSTEQKRMNSVFGKSWNKTQQQRMEEYARKFPDLNMNAKTLGSAMGKLNYALDKNLDITNASTGELLNQKNAQGQLINSTKRFRMEFLSVMFFGMGIQRVFASLTKGSLEAAGAMDIWSIITMMMGFPAAMDLTDQLLELYDAYDDLPEPMKKTLSWTLYLSQGFGALMMYFGMVTLGIQGVAKMFPGLAAAIKDVGFTGVIKGWGNAIFSFASKFAVVIAIIAAIVYGGILSWKENFGNFRGWMADLIDGIKQMFGGVFGFFGELGKALAALLSGDADAFVEHLKGMVGHLGMFAEGLFKALISAAAGVGLAIIRAGLGIAKTFTGIREKLSITQKKAWRGASDWLGSVIEGGAQPMAAGGIVTRPTNALIGEKGPEAVIPLDRAGGGIGTYAPTIHINANISNDMDIEHVAKRVNEYLYSDLRGVSFR
jgi:hypothetical protein